MPRSTKLITRRLFPKLTSQNYIYRKELTFKGNFVQTTASQ